MATVRQYYDSDFRDFVGPEGPMPFWWTARNSIHRSCGKCSLASRAVPRFFVCYVPVMDNPEQAAYAIIGGHEWLRQIKENIQLSVGWQGTNHAHSLSDCVFTGRLIIYIEADTSPAFERDIKRKAESVGLALLVRGLPYMRMREQVMRPMAFISHDSRDKADIAKPLAITLNQNLCRVWYDEFSLNVGDHLREKIEGGLKECKKCILVLTPNFLSNDGWTKREFDGIFTRELIARENVILPVWAGVTAKQVYEYSPILAGRVGLPWSLGCDEVARRLLKVIL